MARTSTRLRPRVGLRDRSTRARRRRNVVSYQENSSDFSETGADPGQAADLRSQHVPSPRTHRRRLRVSYHEDSADSDAVDDAPSQDDFAASTVAPRIPHQRTIPSRSKSSTQAKKRKAPRSSRRNPTFGAKRQKNLSGQGFFVKEELGMMNAAWDGKPMPWATLPYHVWLSILTYASYPLVSTTFDPSPSISWLLRMAFSCKALLEPALTALYYEAPLYSPGQMASLGKLLLQQDEGLATNYRVKVKHLVMDYANMPRVIRRDFMETIIPHLSQLQGIALGVHSDDPKLCRIYTRSLPPAHIVDPTMYTILESSHTQLKSWSWNRTIDLHILSVSSMKDVHLSAPFQSLTSLTLVDFHLPKMVDHNGRQVGGEEALADALNSLPLLRKLRFCLSDTVNEFLMPLLPDNLQTLVLTSCYNLFSPALMTFLQAKGQDLKELVLSHNQSLSLSFLTKLSQACPRLEILKMDLLYYNSHTTFNDSSARYYSLLSEGERPSWPTSLRHLELHQLRKWKKPAAELFFSSLINSARDLPDLRHMEVKASIDESSWRDRIAFRDKWVQQLKDTFLRNSPPPNPHLSSYAAFQKWKLRQKVTSARADMEDLHSQPLQRMSDPKMEGSAIPTVKSVPYAEDSDDSDAPLTKVRRSARRKAQKEGNYNESEDSDGEPTSGRGRRMHQGSGDFSNQHLRYEDGDTKLVSQYVQGLCNVVDIVIDNLRPAEEQLHESDFLDEEPSGDEDWNGDNDMEDGRYAW